MPAITITIGVATCAKFIAEYLGLIGSTVSNTSVLRHEPLISAIAFLNEAKNCTDETLMIKYLDDARRNFRKAVSLEENERKVTALLGVAMCQKMLGDYANSKINIQGIKNVTLSRSEIARIRALQAVQHFSHLYVPVMIVPPYIDLMNQRRADLESFKNSAMKFNNKLSSLVPPTVII